MEILKQTYFDPAHPGSFGGIDSMYRALKGKVSRPKIKEWLAKQNTYTLHRSVRRHFSRNRVIVSGIDEQFQADLVDLQSLVKFNDSYKYILTCIDIFSKYAWAIPLKQKDGTNIVSAFKLIFKERKPQQLQTDQGTEFTNRKFQTYLRSEQVHFFTTHNETKASVVERFNRTLKTKMWKYFTEFNTFKYIDILGKLVDSYNHTYHRSIKMEPASVTPENQKQVWHHLYGDLIENKNPSFKFSVGDTVRVAKTKLHFEKSYETNWSEELFTIYQRIARNPPVYKIKDLMDEEIKGTFYEQELQKVFPNDAFPIEKILGKKRRKNKIEYFVKFKGYPTKFNAWVPAKDMFQL